MTTQQRLLALLHARAKPLTLTQIGESLWHKRVNRQSFARPAGAVVKRAVLAGLVRQATPRDGVSITTHPARWILTAAGRQTFSDPNQPDLIQAQTP
jgi:hypothetical protein